MRILPLATTLLLAFPLTAQVGGSINSNAPTVSQSIEFSDESKLALSYTAIHFGEGQWMNATENEQLRERINGAAQRRPMGSVHTSIPLVAAGRKVPAGEYDMYFTLHERGAWLLNLKPKGDDGGDPIVWRLALKETEHKHTRMHIALGAAAEANEALLTIAFGNMGVHVPLKPAPAEGESGGGEGSGN